MVRCESVQVIRYHLLITSLLSWDLSPFTAAACITVTSFRRASLLSSMSTDCQNNKILHWTAIWTKKNLVVSSTHLCQVTNCAGIACEATRVYTLATNKHCNSNYNSLNTYLRYISDPQPGTPSLLSNYWPESKIMVQTSNNNNSNNNNSNNKLTILW